MQDIFYITRYLINSVLICETFIELILKAKKIYKN